MTDYIATSTDLTAVANAIRTKGGTSAQLVWPQGYIEAVDDLSGSMSDEAKAAIIDALRHIDYPIDDANDVYKHLEELLALGIVTVDPSGSIAITDAKGGEPVCLKLHLAPTQDLHGYPYPWTEGNGKNKCSKFSNNNLAGVTIFVYSNGTLTTSGTATGTVLHRSIPGITVEKDAVYYGCGAPTDGTGSYGFTLRYSNGNSPNDNGIFFGTCDFYNGNTGRIASAATNQVIYCNIRMGSGASVPSTSLWYPMIALIGRNNHMAGKLSTGSEGGLTFTQNEYGAFVVNGTCTEKVYWGANITLPAGDYTVAGNRSTMLWLLDPADKTPMSEVEGFTGSDSFPDTGGDFSLDREITMWCGFVFYVGESYANKAVYPVVCDLVEPNYASYAPYAANICPFTQTVGSSVSLNHGADTTTYNTESVSIPSYTSFYGGYVDFVNRSLVRYTYYASYAGEPLRGKWLSSKDRYLPGTTPTTGAEVIDMELVTQLATTINPVALLAGNNTIWSSDGDVVLTYETAQ